MVLGISGPNKPRLKRTRLADSISFTLPAAISSLVLTLEPSSRFLSLPVSNIPWDASGHRSHGRRDVGELRFAAVLFTLMRKRQHPSETRGRQTLPPVLRGPRVAALGVSFLRCHYVLIGASLIDQVANRRRSLSTTLLRHTEDVFG